MWYTPSSARSAVPPHDESLPQYSRTCKKTSQKITQKHHKKTSQKGVPARPDTRPTARTPGRPTPASPPTPFFDVFV